VTDAAVLTASADGALVVVSAGKTLDTHLRDALANLQAVHGHTLGVVLNRVAKGAGSGYYGGYYGQPAAGRPEAPAEVRAATPAKAPAKAPAEGKAASPR
jgi:Mrp family chromosome partitioning ATPase